MKKLTLTAIAVLGVTTLGFAQGVVNWTGVAGYMAVQTNATVYSSFVASSGNASGTVGNTAANSAANNTALGYNGYYYALLVSSSSSTVPTTLAAFSSWSNTGLTATNSYQSGGKIVQVAGTAASTVQNWAAGATESVILVGWSANLGTSWSTVLSELQTWSTSQIANAYFGVSTVGSDVAIASPGPGNQIFGTSAGQIEDNSTTSPMQLNLLYAVPEPGTMALAALGGASLLLFRRKK